MIKQDSITICIVYRYINNNYEIIVTSDDTQYFNIPFGIPTKSYLDNKILIPDILINILGLDNNISTAAKKKFINKMFLKGIRVYSGYLNNTYKIKINTYIFYCNNYLNDILSKNIIWLPLTKNNLSKIQEESIIFIKMSLLYMDDF